MYVDPRWLATPIGAVVGLAVARKALHPDDRTIRNLTIGTGIGAGAGFLTGQYIKGNPLAFGNTTEDKYQKYIRNVRPSGGVPSTEVAAVHKIMRDRGEGGVYGKGSGKTVSHDTRPGWKQNYLSSGDQEYGATPAGEVQQSVALAARIQAFNKEIARSDISAGTRKKLVEARTKNERHKRRADSNISTGAYGLKGMGASWKTLKGFMVSALNAIG